jgi:hypothetical protein
MQLGFILCCVREKEKNLDVIIVIVLFLEKEEK